MKTCCVLQDDPDTLLTAERLEAPHDRDRDRDTDTDVPDQKVHLSGGITLLSYLKGIE